MQTNISEQDLLKVQKPAQYLGGEQNAVYKDDLEIDAHIALAFPDTYEVGMSHLGIQILYQIINEHNRAWAERVYMPFPDMEELMRERGAVLCSLEAKRPLSDFDIVGFSLQYELCSTNILAMLDLANIPFLAAKRCNDDPVIIGGGPYTYHPEALADFFDAFFLGDAEEFFPELIAALCECKTDGKLNRSQFLKRLAEMQGVYVPSEFEPNYDEEGRLLEVKALNDSRPTITRRLLPSLDGAAYAKNPVVPNVNTVHNRLSVEVMRGCVRGCRFCQAGYLYRPQRERKPQEIVEMIEDSISKTGFEEVSLLSLSTADYCSVVPLLRTLMDSYGEGDKLAISFPSTRVDALTPEVLEQVQRVRRTGFTVAPEGGTQRLRDVINKGVSDEQILETSRNVFRLGWTGIKLYFMIGLPTETDEDLYGIIDIAKRIKALPEAAGKDITVSASTHVPKPHTPFQWAEQITANETIRRQRLLTKGLREAGVNFRYHDPFSSFLEGVFCRSGRELAPVILRAYELGCRLDAWKEHLKEETWMQAFLDCNIDPNFYLRERSVEEALPWDHLSCDIPKSYFAKEYRRALRDKTTADCLTSSCSVCGACDYDISKNVLWPRRETEQWYNEQQEQIPEGSGPGPDPSSESAERYRLKYEKSGFLRFLGHLELVKIFHRACRRAEIPLSFSAGFHPLPRMSFGPPLQLGISSIADYVDIYLSRPGLEGSELINRLNSELPSGLIVKSAARVSKRAESLQECITKMRFRVQWLCAPSGIINEYVHQESKVDSMPDLTQLYAAEVHRAAKLKRKKTKGRKKKGKDRRFLIGDYVTDIKFPECCSPNGIARDFEFSLAFDPLRGGPKALEVVSALSGLDASGYLIEKIDTIFSDSPINYIDEDSRSKIVVNY